MIKQELYGGCDQRTNFQLQFNGRQHLNSPMFWVKDQHHFGDTHPVGKKMRFVCHQVVPEPSSIPWVHMLVSESCPRAPRCFWKEIPPTEIR